MKEKNLKDSPCLFLDIDGVIALQEQHFSNKIHPVYNCCYYDRKAVKVLNSIIDNVSGLKLILSSDWKLSYNITKMNIMFKENKINLPLEDFTTSLWGAKNDEFNSLQQLEECRAAEILKYVSDHGITNWVAVDDLDLRKWIGNDHFVHTPRPKEGIKQSGVSEKIINILNNEK